MAAEVYTQAEAAIQAGAEVEIRRFSRPKATA